MVAQFETPPTSSALPAWITEALGAWTGPQPVPKTVIAHPQALVRQAIRLLLEATDSAEVLAEVEDGPASVASCVDLQPDVAILYAELPQSSGIEAARIIGRRVPNVRLLVLGERTTAAAALRAVEAGALVYLPASAGLAELVHALRAIRRGESYFTPDVARLLVQACLPRRRLRDSTGLSPREVEILGLLAAGEPNRRIAAELRISVKTVEAHKANMVKKLGLRNTFDLVRYALAQAGSSEHLMSLSRAS